MWNIKTHKPYETETDWAAVARFSKYFTNLLLTAAKK